MLPVALFGQAESIFETGDHGGRHNFNTTKKGVLRHKRRINEDPRKPVGSNKVTNFMMNAGTEKSIGEIIFLAEPVATGARGDLHVSGWSQRVWILVWG